MKPGCYQSACPVCEKQAQSPSKEFAHCGQEWRVEWPASDKK